MSQIRFRVLITSVLLSLTMLPAFATEVPIGQAVEKNGMAIGAVYLQPVDMPHFVPTVQTPPPDIHLELDIHATKANRQGFALGEWIPYLQVSYHLKKINSDWEQLGQLVPMVASDGPHYGLNIALNGPGKYALTYHLNPPSWNGFFRHADKETGVDNWWEPFDVHYTFAYVGTGKKGGY